MTAGEDSGAQPVDRHDVAEAFRSIAELLEALGENPFKTRAYVNGARAIEQLEGELGELITSGRLAKTKGFGPALVEKATTYWKTGRLPYLEELKERFPQGLLDLQGVPGLGPKKALAVHGALGVETLDQLEEAARAGKLRELPGFGVKTEAKILEGVAFARTASQRRLRSAIEEPALHLLELVRRIRGVASADLAGSLRRKRETVADVDVIVAGDDAARIVEAFTKLAPVASVLSRGENRCSVRMGSRLQADLIVVQPEQYGAALVHFTGSKEFNAALRGLAKAKKLKLNEYGLFRTAGSEEKPLAVADEESVFQHLGLPWIPPELREGPEDVELALAEGVPRLVELKDLRGVLHVHSVWSDGRDELEDMVLTAQEQGFEYVGVSDHSQTASYANGMTVERVLEQRRVLDALQKKVRIRILKGVESDILPDGSLDFPDEILDGFDFVIASVHSQFRMDHDEMTKRMVRAVSHRQTTVLGHPTGRKLLSREGYTFDLDEVMKACRKAKTAIEINAWPNRLDLDWRQARKLPGAGVLACLNPDAHRTSEVAFVRYGVDMARKARLGPDDVLNTRSADEIVSRKRA